MTFHSILFRSPEDEHGASLHDPGVFADLHLDQIVAAVIEGRESYDLAPLLKLPLRSVAAIAYRHAIMQDIEKERIRSLLLRFSSTIREINASLGLAAKSSYVQERSRRIVDAAEKYCEGIRRLVEGLAQDDVTARGLTDFRGYLDAYVQGAEFTMLSNEANSLVAMLSNIDYRLVINASSLTVRDASDEENLVASIEATFERFRGGSVKNYLLDFKDRPTLNHIEAKVLELIAQLHPNVFEELERFEKAHASFIPEPISRFEREVQFYLAWIEYVRRFEEASLPTCYPRIETATKSVHGEDCFDFALASRLIASGAPVVCNTFDLHGPERIFVVSGPNQGGKTTFARTFGQMHFLAVLGCRVAGRSASLFLSDRVFTHFENVEDATALHGKLEDDVLRIHAILESATGRSIIILNEIFSSTTAHDASILARRIIEEIVRLDSLCVCVTFIDELATLSEQTVSLVSVVDAKTPTVRTYKLTRQPPNGVAYAVSLAHKYGLTYERLKDRLDERSSA